MPFTGPKGRIFTDDEIAKPPDGLDRMVARGYNVGYTQHLLDAYWDPWWAFVLGLVIGVIAVAVLR